MSKIKTLVLLAAVGLLILPRLVGCGDVTDELATLDLLLCEVDAECSEGVCVFEEEEVDTRRFLARSIESIEASRFGDDGLFVLATWELDERYLELEMDLPTNWVGYVDMDLRYSEFINGESVYQADDFRGRIELVEPLDGDLPYAAHIELRMESADGEVRRIHMGRLEPDDEEAVGDPGPSETPIEWEREGVELLIVRSSSGGSYTPVYPESGYDYDYSSDGSAIYIVDEACAAATSEGCSGDDPDYEGDSDYYESEGCSGDSGGCSGDDSDDGYYDDAGNPGCSGSSDDGSWCEGDSEDDVWEDDSDYGCDCSDDGYYEDSSYDSGSSCEGDDYDSEGVDCSGDGGSSSSGESCGGCEGDAYEVAGAARHRRTLRERARGIAPRQVRRAASFMPLAFAFWSTRLMRRRRERD